MWRAVCVSVGLMSVLSPSASRAEWRREPNSIAWCRGGAEAWRFVFDPAEGKPHFAVLAPGGVNLVAAHPENHVWHYGLWFSWKLINGVNYWEELGTPPRAEGETRWTAPEIATQPEGAATIRLRVSHGRDDGRVEFSETRELRLSAPAPDGSFAIDWSAHFVAGDSTVVLDRTPMPGEPGGQVNGGYGGLGLRLAITAERPALVTPGGVVTRFENERARPHAAALGCNLAVAGQPLGSVAIINLVPASGAAEAIPWYVANTPAMRFVCAAILAPRPLTLEPGATLDLRYRILVRPIAWTPEALRAAVAVPRE